MNPPTPTKTANKKQQLSEKLARAEANLAEEAARYKSDDARRPGQKKSVTWKPNGLVMAMHFLMDTKPMELWEGQPEEVPAHDQGIDDGKLKATVQWRHPIDLAIPENKRVHDSEIPGKLFVRGKHSVEKGVQVQREKGIFGAVYLAGQVPPPNPSDPSPEAPDDLSQMQDMPYHLLADGAKEDTKVPDVKLLAGSLRRSQELEIKETGLKPPLLPPPPPLPTPNQEQVKLQQQQQQTKHLKEQELLLLQTRQKRLQMEQLLVQQELDQHLAATRASLQSDVKSQPHNSVPLSRPLSPELVLPNTHQGEDIVLTPLPPPVVVRANSSASSSSFLLPTIRPQTDVRPSASTSSSSFNCQRLSSSDLVSNLSDSRSGSSSMKPASDSLSRGQPLLSLNKTLVSDTHKSSLADPWSQLETLPLLTPIVTRIVPLPSATKPSAIPPPPLPPLAQPSFSRSSVSSPSLTLPLSSSPKRPPTPPRPLGLDDSNKLSSFFQLRSASPPRRPLTPPPIPPARPVSPKSLDIKAGPRPSQMRPLVPRLASDSTSSSLSASSLFNSVSSYPPVPIPPHLPPFPPHPPPILSPSIPPPPPRPETHFAPARSEDPLADLLSDPSALENMMQSIAEVTQTGATTMSSRHLTASEKLQALISNVGPSKPIGPPPLPPALPPPRLHMVDERGPGDDTVRRFGFGSQFARTESNSSGVDDRSHPERFDERYRSERPAPWPTFDQRYDRPHEPSRDQSSFDDRDRRRNDERSNRLIRVERAERSERPESRDYKRTREGDATVQVTKRCKNFASGNCKFGSKCHYMHPEDSSTRTLRGRGRGSERP